MEERKNTWEQTEENDFLVAEMSLTYSTNVRPALRPKIQSSQDAYDLFNYHWDQETIELYESFKVMLLNRNNLVLGIVPIGNGGISSVVVDPKLIFSAALLASSSAIILAHNHPSGNNRPSEADLRLTRKMQHAGNVLDIKVLDHIILMPDDRFYSLADENMM